ncbi:EAL domain-containing protein [Shewanella schlegeliana]|uniref:EAL domain-containing protein n=1 Tax=Shewanella schlegeliana TaxID=190308 RepID=A0ABS1T1E0_9GAMM|nr:EAL domain-containing protein [Shewanella schlegeliana]MBL4914588.1 EAL domain-containing protein [Shewanella schlegeliana]MCL1109596.1 EAL domain-containing protein [Shewanella schlegeliana]GIU29851.1 GGDEF domain-containing protein [Shewanella schlegeliana]
MSALTWSKLYPRVSSADPALYEQLSHWKNQSESTAVAILRGQHFLAATPAALSYFESLEQNFIHATPFDFSPRLQSSGRSSVEYGLQMIKKAAKGEVVSFNWLHMSQQGKELPTLLTLYPALLDGDQILLVFFKPMDRRKRSRASISNGFETLPKELMSITLEDSAEAVYITNEDNQILAVNKAMCRICGYSAEHLLGKTPLELKLELQQKSSVPDTPLKGTGSWQGEVKKCRSDGSTFPAWQSCRRIYADNTVFYVNLFSDISEKKALEAKLTQQAMYDKLTGLPNRFHLIQLLSKAINNIKKSPEMIGALMFLDLNGFKNINDSFGHSTGDKVLQLVAARLEACCIENAEIARLGGDEFTLVLPLCHNREEIEAFSEQILSLFEAPFEINGQKFYLGTSIGISLFPQQSDEPNQLLSMADTAMYSAKKSPNHIRFYNATIREAAEKKLHTLNDLRHAQGLGQFSLAYQSIIDLESNDIVAVEALLRWTQNNGEIVEAQDFIPLLEEAGLMVSIGQWALEQACIQMQQWQQEFDPQLKISVNISRSQLEHPDFIPMLKGLLARTQLPANTLIIEITESALIHRPKFMANVLAQLKEMNISIAIDDFGAGLSSLSRLSSLPLDSLKIDSAFAQRLNTNQGQKLCKAIMQLAQTLEIDVVVEGIETQSQRDLLLNLGKGMGQGYFFDKPVKAESFTLDLLSPIYDTQQARYRVSGR